MSQPRRRRRRRRRSGRSEGQPQQAPTESPQQAPSQQSGDGRSRRRRRRGKKGQPQAPASPKSSEDLVRAAKKQPATLTAPHDGTTLDEVIGDLQSTWGVPQNPQEFRLTLKVAEDKEPRTGRPSLEEVRQDSEERDETVSTGMEGRPREKAPAAPRIGAAAEGESRRKSSGRRRRSRKRMRKSG